MIRETSLSAYEDAKKGLNDKQEAVYSIILERGELCDKQIAELLGWEINRVTPRRGELLNANLIKDLGIRKYGARSVHFWSANFEKPKQLDLLAA